MILERLQTPGKMTTHMLVGPWSLATHRRRNNNIFKVKTVKTRGRVFTSFLQRDHHDISLHVVATCSALIEGPIRNGLSCVFTLYNWRIRMLPSPTEHTSTSK